MHKRMLRVEFSIILICAAPAAVIRARAQQSTPRREVAPYGSNFFEQLRTIFGRFRESDLQRVFREAQPVQCSELTAREGEWRPVAFFNENRSLGDWCREDLQEVKADLTVYKFKGTCSGDRSTIKVGTEFPTAEGLQAYSQGRLELDQVDVTVNDPVKATLNSRTMAYTFELPYLFVSKQDPKEVYSFLAPNRNSTYATDVSSRWECKAVSSRDVTYRFLICRVSTVPRRALAQHERWLPVFGSNAFFILSDGMEAQTSVKLTFGDATQPAEKTEEK
jgi:hypothetical protein